MPNKKVIIINSATMGRGSEELGKTIMGAFLRKVWASETKPEAIVFYNEGVKLLAQGSEVLDALTALADFGVDLLACGTCVKFFDLDSSIRVGRISNMEEILDHLLQASSVITI